MLKDISWGSIILGAAVVTAVAAVALAGSFAAVPAMLAGASTTTNAVLGGAAVVGGVLGNMTSKLLHRAQDATTTLVGR
jgi:hypothetical protein